MTVALLPSCGKQKSLQTLLKFSRGQTYLWLSSTALLVYGCLNNNVKVNLLLGIAVKQFENLTCYPCHSILVHDYYRYAKILILQP